MSKDDAKKGKILIVTGFPTEGAGSGALISTQAKSYVKMGYDVEIITANNRTDFDKIDGVKYVLVPFTGEGENPEKIEGQLPFNYPMFTTHTESTENYWKSTKENMDMYREKYKEVINKEVERFKPDVIHGQHVSIVSSLCVDTNVPTVVTVHGTGLMAYERSKKEIEKIDEKLKDKDLDKMERAHLIDEKEKYQGYIKDADNAVKKAKKIIVISKDQKSRFLKMFGDKNPGLEEKTTLEVNGYDEEVFYKDKEHKTTREEAFEGLKAINTEDGKIPLDYDSMSLFVGKFADFKGIDASLDAFKKAHDELKKQNKKHIFVIVGSGALNDKLQKQVKKLNIEDVYFVGKQKHETIRKLHQVASEAIVNSRHEPDGLVVKEAMATGDPILGSNDAGVGETVNTEKKDLPQGKMHVTPVGVLVSALPDRPSSLSDDQKEILDDATHLYTFGNTDYAMGVAGKLGLGEESAKKYFEVYKRNVDEQAQAMEDIALGKITFDKDENANYAKSRFSQDVVSSNYIKIFEEASGKKLDFER